MIISRTQIYKTLQNLDLQAVNGGRFIAFSHPSLHTISFLATDKMLLGLVTQQHQVLQSNSHLQSLILCYRYIMHGFVYAFLWQLKFHTFNYMAISTDSLIYGIKNILFYTQNGK